ncbi:MAG: hypothetical protein J7497_13010, partial [Chitinophagaceae bacterium]|nr:hypothetical protein [Chitinophagaceae bacterium]
IAEDKSGIIWIGTYSGISYYDYRHHSLRTLDTKGFLSGRRLVGIVTDNENNLWASTNNGLIRIDSTRTVFTSYDKFDGLPGDVFNNNSFSKDNAGRLYFGGYNGFVAFDPALIKMNKMTPGIILTGLSVNNANVRPRDGSDILFGDIVATKEIQLAYNQNIIKINYAVLNYIKPLKNKSAYMLAGFDRDWTITQQQEAAYTNLPPGTYKLFLKGANNDGVWSAPRLYLTIVVHPPFWRTWWAYLIYVLLFLAALYGAFRFFLSREKFKRDFQYEHMLNVKQTELHQMKMDFFTHISHEIRTPLTMIVGPADMLMEQDLPPHVGKKLLSSIKSNAERLLKLTNDLLDFRKADDGYMRLRLQHTDLVGFSKKVFEKFAGKALQQSVNYTFETKEEKMAAWFDPGQIEIVIANLLSNALKFTNEYGVVKMIMEKNRDYAFINVMDNGAGIPVDDQGKIFTHFYQAAAGDDSKTGSGIGLAFSKKLMELHGGDLSFTSKTHETRFVITIPLGKWYLHTTNKYVTTI